MQALERVLVWPLQGWEQAVHSDHGHQPPGTVKGRIGLGCSCCNPETTLLTPLLLTPPHPVGQHIPWQGRSVQLSLPSMQVLGKSRARGKDGSSEWPRSLTCSSAYLFLPLILTRSWCSLCPSSYSHTL